MKLCRTYKLKTSHQSYWMQPTNSMKRSRERWLCSDKKQRSFLRFYKFKRLVLIDSKNVSETNVLTKLRKDKRSLKLCQRMEVIELLRLVKL